MKRERNKYILIASVLLAALFLTGCSTANKDGSYNPIEGFNSAIDLLVWPMAGLMWGIGKTVAFGNYGVVIILATIIVRTCAWPIYAKTNDMSLKMQWLQNKLRFKKDTKEKLIKSLNRECKWK